MDLEEIEAQQKQKVDPNVLTTAGTGSAMTLRDRFRRTLQYQRVDRIPNFEFGYWDSTLSNWHEQGLPKEIDSEWKAYEYFGIENYAVAPINTGMTYGFDSFVVEETEDYITAVDGNRTTYQVNKKGDKSIPHYIDFGLKTREDWEEFKKRVPLGPDGRYPDNWDELAPKYNERDYPLAVSVGSMIGVPRNWIGFHNIALMCYDDPALLEEIVEHLCQVVETTIERALRDVEFDFGAGWEDICFNSGPIISPRIYRDIVLPRYRRIADLLNRHGVHIIWTDCDGNLTSIVDIMLDGGFNCLFPVEVNGGTDPVALRERWGKQLLFVGGVCKMKLKGSFSDIERELGRLLPVVEEGGFIPHVDHRVPADVPLANYKYYLKLKRQVFRAGTKPPQYDE